MLLAANDLVQYAEAKKLSIEDFITLLDLKMKAIRATEKINDQ
jgi:hypothetical protein